MIVSMQSPDAFGSSRLIRLMIVDNHQSANAGHQFAYAACRYTLTPTRCLSKVPLILSVEEVGITAEGQAGCVVVSA